MGWFSSDDNSEKTTDNTGNENINNVIIQDPVKLQHTDLIICIYIITIILLLNFVYTAFKIYQKHLKKRYTRSVAAEMNTL